jgi:putative NADH-flavin reductase
VQLSIFGATGRTGGSLVEQALSAGHGVTVLVRHPSKVKTGDPNLQVITGNLQNGAAIAQAIRGTGAVISVLGPMHNQPTYDISAGMDSIIAAMKKAGVRRLIVSAGAAVGDPHDSPGPLDHFISFLLRIFSRYVYEDMLQVVAKVRASDLDWTIVRIPVLTDGPRTGKVNVGYVGKGMGPRISRADLAGFMLQQLTDDTCVGKAPAISN